MAAHCAGLSDEAKDLVWLCAVSGDAMHSMARVEERMALGIAALLPQLGKIVKSLREADATGIRSKADRLE